ncbi:MAG: hypothetical protein VX705_07305 [Verrucomicrobiota bacterium]|nr:hypothetical protein [Verrucomicrobiota bacterium]
MMSESKKPEGENDQGGEMNPADSTPDSGKPKTSEEEAQAQNESTGEQTITEPATATARTVGKIEALEEIRQQQRLWRYGTYVGALVFLVVVLVVISKARSFIPPTTDPNKLVEQTRSMLAKTNYQGQNNWEKLVLGLKEGWEKDLRKDLTNILYTTTNSIAKNMVDPWVDLNKRSADVVKAANSELRQLETTLPQATETVIKEHLKEVILQQDKKLKQINPNAEKKQVELVLQQLIDLSGTHAEKISADLFSEHLVKLDKIFKDMETIHRKEQSGIKGAIPNWEMALLVLDILREEVRPLQSQRAAPSASSKPQKNPRDSE